MYRAIGTMGLLFALAAAVLGTGMAWAAQGNGCEDGSAIRLVTMWRLSCGGANCPPTKWCVAYESTEGADTVWDCVCDPTPEGFPVPPGGGYINSDESGDETSPAGGSLCHTRLRKKPKLGGGFEWHIECSRVDCAQECVPDVTDNPQLGFGFCDCPGS